MVTKIEEDKKSEEPCNNQQDRTKNLLIGFCVLAAVTGQVVSGSVLC